MIFLDCSRAVFSLHLASFLAFFNTFLASLCDCKSFPIRFGIDLPVEISFVISCKLGLLLEVSAVGLINRWSNVSRSHPN